MAIVWSLLKKKEFLWNYNSKYVENVLSAYELLMGKKKHNRHRGNTIPVTLKFKE